MRFYICLVLVVCGALSALFKEFPDEVSCNFIYNICVDEATNPLAYIIWLCILNAILFLSAYMAIYHYGVYLLNLGILYVYSLAIFRLAFASVFISPLFGTIYLILFIIPVVVVAFLSYVTVLMHVYDLSGYVINKRAKINVSVYTSKLVKVVCSRCAISVAFGVILQLLLHCTVLIIVSI
ncbi:MAG: hypothetical protein R3Y23_03315 [Bacillota bacterium]